MVLRWAGRKAARAPSARRHTRWSLVIQRAPVFRPAGDAAVLLLTNADPLQLQLEAVSIDGDTVRTPRLIDSGHRMAVTEPPQVASLPDGRIVAVWRRITPPRVQLVVANETTPGGEWTAPLVISPAGERAGTPGLVVTRFGQPAVTWGSGGRVLLRALRVGARVTGGRTSVMSGSHSKCHGQASAPSGERAVIVAFACEAGRNVYIASRVPAGR